MHRGKTTKTTTLTVYGTVRHISHRPITSAFNASPQSCQVLFSWWLLRNTPPAPSSALRGDFSVLLFAALKETFFNVNKQTAPSYDGRFYSLRAQPVMHHQEMEEDDDDDDCVAAANGRAHTHAPSRTGRRNQQQATRTSSTVRLEALLTLNYVNFELQERTACVDLLCDARGAATLSRLSL